MVKNGYYLVVYCSQESALSTTIWRDIFEDVSFREKLVGVAIDEFPLYRAMVSIFYNICFISI